jgi:hypothetical protein
MNKRWVFYVYCFLDEDDAWKPPAWWTYADWVLRALNILQRHHKTVEIYCVEATPERMKDLYSKGFIPEGNFKNIVVGQCTPGGDTHITDFSTFMKWIKDHGD